MIERLICLDVDEVLADWSGAALRLFGLEREPFLARWFAEAPDQWDLFSTPAFPLDRREAWARIEAAGADFWAQIEPTPWAGELYSRCRELAPTVLLTRPSRDPASAAGKLAWMQAQFGGAKFGDYLIGPPKHVLARPGVVLVDDHPSNCAAFREAGGAAVLFPALGNERRALREDPLPVVLAELRAALEPTD